jgi:UDP-2-acetamido-2-deoxy-ribo-hexuluronate aminotransferase
MDFIDLKTQQARIRDKIDARIKSILDSGAFVMGPEVYELERALAQFSGAAHCISCSNGTDALLMPLMALGVGPGDGVLVPTFTFFATAEVVSLVGATPIFVDVDPNTFVINTHTLKTALNDAKNRFPDVKPRGIIPVSLFGLCPDLSEIQQFAQSNSLFVMEDAAQSFGAEYRETKSCNIAPISATSFFPAKPLGCYGDGGAIFCSEQDFAEALRSIRIHGQGATKYQNIRIGMNGRLDTIQAAILLEKLAIFPDELEKRNSVATRYTQGLHDVVTTPVVPSGYRSSWAQYTIRTPHRERIIQSLQSKGIPTMVYYMTPLHLQVAYQHLGYQTGDLPVAEQLSGEVVSLPMHPYLPVSDQSAVIEAVRECLTQNM